MLELTINNDWKQLGKYIVDNEHDIVKIRQIVRFHAKDMFMGIGLGSIRRFSDEFEINPIKTNESNDRCTTDCTNFQNCIRTRKWVPNKLWEGSNSKLETGACSKPKPGEKLNGDCFLINHVKQDISIIAVIDGLGHGKEANWASQLAKEQIINKSASSVDDIMQHIHRSLKGTRGAVVGLALLNTDNQKLSFRGIGNI